MDGLLDAGQADKENDLSSSAMPQFWSRAGEERQVPVEFESAVRAAIKGSALHRLQSRALPGCWSLVEGGCNGVGEQNGQESTICS